MRKVLYFLIFFWITFAFINVFYNVIKTTKEIKEWGIVTDNEKRHRLFGDLYNFFVLVNNYTERDAKILVYSDDGMTSGVGRYYIYPRLLVWPIPRDEKTLRMFAEKDKYKYIFSYNKILSFNGYEKIASFSSKTSTNYAILYKLK